MPLARITYRFGHVSGALRLLSEEEKDGEDYEGNIIKLRDAVKEKFELAKAELKGYRKEFQL